MPTGSMCLRRLGLNRWSLSLSPPSERATGKVYEPTGEAKGEEQGCARWSRSTPVRVRCNSCRRKDGLSYHGFYQGAILFRFLKNVLAPSCRMPPPSSLPFASFTLQQVQPGAPLVREVRQCPLRQVRRALRISRNDSGVAPRPDSSRIHVRHIPRPRPVHRPRALPDLLARKSGGFDPSCRSRGSRYVSPPGS